MAAEQHICRQMLHTCWKMGPLYLLVSLFNRRIFKDQPTNYEPPQILCCAAMSQMIPYLRLLLQGLGSLQAHQLVIAGALFVEHTPSQQQFPQLQ